MFVSKKLEIDYTKALLTIVNEMHAQTVTELTAIFDAKPQVGDSVLLVNDGLFDSFKSAFTRLSKTIKDKVASIAEKLASLIVNRQKQASDSQLVDMLRKETGIDFTGLMRDEALNEAVTEAVSANVALINSIPQQYLDKIEQAVMAGLQAGTLNRDLAKELEKIEGVTQNRARLIATDQLGKINSRLSQVRQQALGITHYIWRTSRDERVRHSHSLREGKLFAWNNPPPDGHPGQPIRCRCTAEPYTEHLTSGKSPDEAMEEQGVTA